MKKLANHQKPVVLVPLVVRLVPVEVEVPLLVVPIEVRNVAVVVPLTGGTRLRYRLSGSRPVEHISGLNFICGLYPHVYSTK